MLKALTIIALCTAMPCAAHAQSETPSWDPAAAGRLGVLIDGTRQPNRAGPPAAPSAKPAPSASTAEQRARATCANKGSARERLGPDHPQVRELYRLCAQAGY